MSMKQIVMMQAFPFFLVVFLMWNIAPLNFRTHPIFPNSGPFLLPSPIPFCFSVLLLFFCLHVIHDSQKPCLCLCWGRDMTCWLGTRLMFLCSYGNILGICFEPSVLLQKKQDWLILHKIVPDVTT